MIALALVTALLLADAPAGRAVVLPIKVVEKGTAAHDAAAAVERKLVHALGRHAAFELVDSAELNALMEGEAKAQLNGCDSEGCLAEVADALDAQFIIGNQLSLVEGLWGLDATLLDRRSTTVLRRAGVRVRSLDALLLSTDAVARELLGDAPISADDPRLAERLGTTPAGVQELRKRVVARHAAGLSSTWTDLVIEKNRESGSLPMAAALVLLGGGGLVVALAACAGAIASLRVAIDGAPAAPDRRALPVLGLGLVVLALSTLATVLVAAATSGVLVLLGWRFRASIRVGKDGCCRDELRLRAAESPTTLRRVALGVAGVAVGLALVAPVAFVAGVFLAPVPYLLLAGLKPHAGLVFDAPTLAAASVAIMSSLLLATGGAGIFLALVATERNALLSDDARH